MASASTTGSIVALLAALLAIYTGFEGWADRIDNSLEGQQNGEDVLRLIAQGDEFLSQKDFAQAAKTYIDVLKTHAFQHQEVVIYNLGLAFASLGHHRNALSSFQQAADMIVDVRMDPQRRKLKSEALVMAGESASRIGWWERAVRAFQEATGHTHASPTLWFNLGSSLINLHQSLQIKREKAGQHTEDTNDDGNTIAAPLSSSSSSSPSSSSSSLMDRAVESLKNAYSLSPQNDKFAAYYGTTLITSGREEEGNRVLERWMEKELRNDDGATATVVDHDDDDSNDDDDGDKDDGGYGHAASKGEGGLKASNQQKGTQVGSDGENRALHMYVGFRLGDVQPRIAARHLEVAARMELAARDSGRASVQLSSIFYRLGRAYRAMGDLDAEKECYKSAVSQGVWTSTEQRPGYLFPGRALPSSPFPHINRTLKNDPKFHDVWRLVSMLEDSSEEIEEEFRRFYSSRHPSLHEDNENIADHGSWRQLIFARNGRLLPQMWRGAGKDGSGDKSERMNSVLANDAENRGGNDDDDNHDEKAPALIEDFPITRQILMFMRKDLSSHLPKGSMEFSILASSSHLRPHCGPSNHRLRLHLPIILPRKPVARIRAGKLTLEWEKGKVLVLDDSYDHEVRQKRVSFHFSFWK
mmetsp:Transcript_2570/g.3480  ORF Transcript_2570/g.3480 Transcript_2570/m.3480 type:complete len:641 (-) Transcript_2570:203-2125(-)